ncbi:protein-S-isoprenylcysteine O-methyltransferase Ste14 [Natronospira proteinivora]|uniref:Protein-S-isoprenylcysteine O-methyltransferase Ste14 n=1 Tax=Natronospira proteinivora TaxID=1807133 RepID=A0ABT1G7A4_9GAMM|nr:isoprenylcysteine carboxylmethyltransferase family protein [Natronospira proteinivora]MCP1727160.1 protein-S-isoprenylcysteine O-methyltransferase Ste14 [Natronospira proteinivora]
MSHRTSHLPEARNAVHHFIREMRYHEASRQLLALAYILVLAVFADGQWPAFYWVGFGTATVGMLIRLWASGHVKKNKELATDGPYAYVRHPLYVGNILLLAGFCIASQLWWSVPVMLAFLWFYYPTAISYEDRKLRQLFGDQWEQWSANTRALLPRFQGRGFRFGGWSLRQSLMSNGEPLIIAYVIYCGWHLVVL